MTATVLESLQKCLAAEHAAVSGYGVLGGVLAGTAPGSPDLARAVEDYDVHRHRRDSLTTLIAALKADPVAAEAAYATPFPVVTPADCRRLARRIESLSASVYAYAVASSVDRVRAFTADALSDCAVRAVAWGATATPLPGMD